ncbi:MAG: LDL receptor domain-containing protein [Alphaproteobacteria bacterium]|nr:LDL receptor domain-containing protein [Alphaproteobacteria bacterium]
MKMLLAIVAALLVAAAAGRPVCHNITGTCTERGFECVSGEVVPHAQRCNGVEDCSDGTDEFMCEHEDHRPLSERTAEERHAFAQASCVNCNCAATAFTVPSSSAWWPYALVSPTDTALMTGTPANYGGKPCNWKCASSITIGFYRKNRICRGWLCCSRQRQCVQCSGTGGCSQGSTANRCY